LILNGWRLFQEILHYISTDKNAINVEPDIDELGLGDKYWVRVKGGGVRE